MTVHESPEFLKQHGPAIREQSLSRTYKPQRRIGKPDGGVRKLGIPAVLDRVIQRFAQRQDDGHDFFLSVLVQKIKLQVGGAMRFQERILGSSICNLEAETEDHWTVEFTQS